MREKWAPLGITKPVKQKDKTKQQCFSIFPVPSSSKPQHPIQASVVFISKLRLDSRSIPYKFRKKSKQQTDKHPLNVYVDDVLLICILRVELSENTSLRTLLSMD